jgi:hypothetical protein
LAGSNALQLALLDSSSAAQKLPSVHVWDVPVRHERLSFSARYDLEDFQPMTRIIARADKGAKLRRIVWPWNVDALLGLQWMGGSQIRIELKEPFYKVVDAAIRLPLCERQRVIVWASFDGAMTELRFDDIERWALKPDRPIPPVRRQEIARIILTECSSPQTSLAEPSRSNTAR